jgi:hypothetical protein
MLSTLASCRPARDDGAVRVYYISDDDIRYAGAVTVQGVYGARSRRGIAAKELLDWVHKSWEKDKAMESPHAALTGEVWGRLPRLDRFPYSEAPSLMISERPGSDTRDAAPLRWMRHYLGAGYFSMNGGRGLLLSHHLSAEFDARRSAMGAPAPPEPD